MAALKLLLVDPEPLILRGLQRMLQRDGFEIFVASNLFDAIHVVVSEDIDIVVADHDIPPPNGLHLLELLRTHKPNIVRVLTAAGLDLDRSIETALAGTGTLFIQKPWSPVEFRAVLRAAAVVGIADGVVHAVVH